MRGLYIGVTEAGYKKGTGVSGGNDELFNEQLSDVRTVRVVLLYAPSPHFQSQGVFVLYRA